MRSSRGGSRTHTESPRFEARPEAAQGLSQHANFFRIDDGSAFGRIADRLKNQRDGKK